MTSFPFKTLFSVSAALDAGLVKPTVLCDDMLAHLKSYNPSVGAYSQILSATALEEARASEERRDRGEALGPLDGVPIAIKDIIDTTPARCSAGLQHLANYQPEQDATVVRKLRQAGAVILGVTETDPGAFSTRTEKVTNPLAANRIAGGSSGGSGAAVAAGMAFAALGTDTGGSVRIPSACCSIYGFKPTWGRVDTTGVRPLAISVDHVGSIARCVGDLQLVQTILDPQMTHDAETISFHGIRLGRAEGYYQDANLLVKTSMDQIFGTLAQEAIDIQDISLPSPDETMLFHMVNVCKEAANYHNGHFPDDWRNYPQIARETVELGLSYSDETCHAARQSRDQARARVDAQFESVDAIILPVMPVDAPARDVTQFELNGTHYSPLHTTVRYTALFNQTSHPVVCIPAFALPDGRAISIQIVGARNSDKYLLAVARKLEGLLDINVNYGNFQA